MASTVCLSKPSPHAKFPIAIAAVLALYLLGRVIEVLPFSTPSTPIIALEVFSALAFALAHGARHYGLRGIAVFAGICLVIGNALENLGILTGFPFGRYEFLPLMGPQFLHVPILLGLAYVGMAYVSWTIARLILGATGTRIAGVQLITLPLVASLVMTAWDFAQDPVWSTLLHAWRWRNGGIWFGVPPSNFAGWLLTVFLIYSAFAWYLRYTPDARPQPLAPQWGSSILFYALCAGGNVLQLVKTQPALTVADSAGRLWRTASILQASALVSVFVMGSFALLACLHMPKTGLREKQNPFAASI